MIENAPIDKIKVILGLGNPGRRYADNRHNLGHMVIDRLAFLKKEEFARGQGPFVYCQVEIDGSPIFLCKSTTYMNNTGKAAVAIKNYFDLTPVNILAVSDDCNLPLGKIRFRRTGSDGGHNGLASIIASLQSRDFARLRLGVGLNPEDIPLEEYVLEDFNKEEFEVVDKVVEQAVELIFKICTDHIENNSINLT
jgi:PTH1 family peptidyl-tRNA hydrolase